MSATLMFTARTSDPHGSKSFYSTPRLPSYLHTFPLRSSCYIHNNNNNNNKTSTITNTAGANSAVLAVEASKAKSQRNEEGEGAEARERKSETERSGLKSGAYGVVRRNGKGDE